MVIQDGLHELAPSDGRLLVRTTKSGAASKAGHNLLMEVERWHARAYFAPELEQSSFELEADSTSFKVLEGTGGITSLGPEEMQGIVQTINEEVLKGTPISFRSSAVRETAEARIHVAGELMLFNHRAPIEFEIALGDGGRLSGTATVTQTAWGMQPYSALFGTLKVGDEVRVEVEGRLQPTG